MTANLNVTPGPAPIARPWAYRRYWRGDAIALLVLAAIAIAVFAATDADRILARLFFQPDNAEDPFAGRLLPPWRWLHRFVAWPVIVAALGSFAALAASLRSPRWSSRRRQAVAVLLAFAIGPGLLVNMVLKNHWGRPRPVQIREFGGRMEFRAPLDPGASPHGRGKSFPCGHSSAGYVFSIFFLIFRRRRPRAAALWLALSLVYGTALGIGRMAAGGHFASDVVWSALLVHAVNVALYYFALNVPGHEDAIAAGLEIPAVSGRALSVWGALAFAVLVGALLATPHRWDFDLPYPLPEGPPPIVRLRIAADDIRLAFHDEASIRIEGHYEGFGAFNAAIRHRASAVADNDGLRVNFEIVRRGHFTEMEGRVLVRASSGGIAALELEAPERTAIVELTGETPPSYPVRIAARRDAVRLPPAWRPADSNVVVQDAAADTPAP